MWPLIIAAYALSSCHAVIAVLSVIIGVASSIEAEVWMAHRVSPIWSGAFFLLTAAMGAICARRRTVYLVMCFGAFSLVSMVVAVVSIQLLRLGLVNHMSDGDTLKKADHDPMVIMALATAGAEIFVCIISAILSVRLGFRAKAEVHKKNEGTFTVQILGEKDIIIHTTKESDQKYDELSEEQTDSTQSIERRTSDESASDQEKQPLDSSADTASVMLELQDTHM